MKKIIFLFYIILISTSCSRYNFEALVQVEGVEESNSETFSKIQKDLSISLKKIGIDDAKIKVNAESKRLTIQANLNDSIQQQVQAIRSQLNTFSKMEIWWTYKINDKEILKIKSHMPTVDGFVPNHLLGQEKISPYWGTKEVLGSSTQPEKLDIIKQQLESKLEIYDNLKLLWGKENGLLDKNGNEIFDLYMVNTKGRLEAPISSKHLKEVSYQLSFMEDNYEINIKLNEEGALEFQKITREAFINGKRSLAIIVNDKVISAPSVSNGEIYGGEVSISGGFYEEEEVKMLVSRMKQSMNSSYQLILLEEKLKNK